MSCISCNLSDHYLCIDPSGLSCCCGGGEFVDEYIDIDAELAGTGNRRGPKHKDAIELLDPTAAGRKRAAALFPIDAGSVCDWTNLKSAGGGVRPIVGCLSNIATDLHHGPDKSTLNNTLGINLHKICAVCHHRWHGDNDRYYLDRPADGGVFLPINDWVPHDNKTLAGPLDIAEHEILWKIRRTKRQKVVYGDEPPGWISQYGRPGVAVESELESGGSIDGLVAPNQSD